MPHTTLPLTISWLLLTGLTAAGWAQSEDLYPLEEHGVGLWTSFKAPLELEHSIDDPELDSLRLSVRFSVFVEHGEQVKVCLYFGETGFFAPSLGPRLPSTSHVDLITDTRIYELPLSTSSSYNEGDRVISVMRKATLPLSVFGELLAAPTLHGYLYGRSENEVVAKNDLRHFSLDAKGLRTLAALDRHSRDREDP